MAEATTLADVLKRYYGAQSLTFADFANPPPGAALQLNSAQGQIRNLPPRPGDAMAPVAEALSPTMGGYSLGQLLADSYSNAREGNWSGVADRLPMLAPAIFGFGRARPALPKPTPLTPAVKVLKGAGAEGVYSAGPTHGDALTEWLDARRKLGLPEIGDNDWDLFHNHVVDGYTTPDGRFLDRNEAAAHLGINDKGGLESGDLPNKWQWE